MQRADARIRHEPFIPLASSDMKLNPTSLAVLLLVAPTLAAQDAPIAVVEGGRLILAPGEELDGELAKLAIRDGKVIAVGREVNAALIGQAKSRTKFGKDTVILPGFVALHDQLEQAGQLNERIDAFTAELRAADAFDPFDRALPLRVRSGITSVVLAPASDNTFGGIAALVKSRGDRGVVAEREGYLKMAIVPQSLSRERYPTSRMGAAELIRDSFADAKNPLRGESAAHLVLREVLDGSRRVAIHASAHAEILAALELGKQSGFVPLLLDVAEPDKCVDQLRESGVAVALRALDWGSKLEQLEAARALDAAGVRFAFLGDSGAELRRSAALAVKHGVSRERALDAITRMPAELAGFGERVGTLRVGRDADFAVFQGDPIDPTSRLSAVWVDGEPLHSATNETAKKETN